ncbi:NAD(P)-dependent oxidoreductase [Arthrobacter polaris]|uniref:NAD(P)-dependent oxidoreductase n=1 Tax=Arthrobacter polaris TaxID=2813727 RepID=UPI001F20147C|nr:NAD(P)-dependent oxidoreductase [Arthrobacter polaris]UIK89773.1 NAD(P)-dependent oxidoreductase [Arthrobacter polaris]
MSEIKNVAIYGLGNMGYIVAQRIAARFDVKVFDLNAKALAAAQAEFRAQIISTSTDVADCSIVVLSLPNPAVSSSVVTALAQVLAPGSTIIETSTVNPDDVRPLRKILAPHGINIIDASLLAGVSQMANGSATLLLGGDAEVIEANRPVLDAMAKAQIHFGPTGSGAAAKVINNAVAHAVMVVVSEAGSMATAAGISCTKLVDLLSDERMGLHRPLTYRYAERIAQRNFDGGMPLDAARKDSILALELAQKLGVPLFAIQGSHTAYDIAAAAGYGREDYSAVSKVWDDLDKPVYTAPETDEHQVPDVLDQQSLVETYR